MSRAARLEELNREIRVLLESIDFKKAEILNVENDVDGNQEAIDSLFRAIALEDGDAIDAQLTKGTPTFCFSGEDPGITPLILCVKDNIYLDGLAKIIGTECHPEYLDDTGRTARDYLSVFRTEMLSQTSHPSYKENMQLYLQASELFDEKSDESSDDV